MAPKQAPKPEFQEGERVLCFHGPLLYEAKCLKVATEDKQVRYLIHYSGWNKNWDEWVRESRVLKYSEANLQKQHELQRANQEHQAEGRARGGGPGRRGGGASSLQQQKHMETLFQNIRITPPTSAGAAAAAASSPAPAAPAASTSAAAPATSVGTAPAAPAEAPAPAPGPGRKSRKSKQKAGGGDGGRAGPGTSAARDAPQQPRRRTRGDPASKSGAAASTRAQLRVQIPAELKLLLVRDWELVTKQGRLLALPAAKSVDAILDEYVAFQRARGRRDSAEFAADELVAGIRVYFNVLLGTQLLYEAERPQHGRVLAAHPAAPMSRLYGGPHLLRLLVRLGGLLACAPFDDQSLALLFGYLHDFLCFLARDPAAFFDAAEYQEAA